MEGDRCIYVLVFFWFSFFCFLCMCHDGAYWVFIVNISFENWPWFIYFFVFVKLLSLGILVSSVGVFKIYILDLLSWFKYFFFFNLLFFYFKQNLKLSCDFITIYTLAPLFLSTILELSLWSYFTLHLNMVWVRIFQKTSNTQDIIEVLWLCEF